ncbi:MAG: SET domain-containing protein-lysine N-methyltransferase [Acidimicrobiia bacterium]|nr:SET domain-containing protein-lysine N-methyltransferase [Acidimicrobiia bacterium]
MTSSPKRAESPPSLDPKHCCFRLRVGRSPIEGWGVYAEEPIPANRKVIEYTGERISRREANRRSEASRKVFLFTIDSYWCKDGAIGGSGAEYINHCCTPNIRSVVLKGHILYMSLRPIAPGEELTVDYNFGKHEEKHPCRCGSPHCRGTLNEE